jgi:sec-independent protein translocase protein TatA
MFANISWPQLVIVLVLVVLVFGTGKLKSVSKDVGGAIRGFKKSMNDEPETPSQIDKSEKADATFTAEETKAKDKVES